MIWRLGIASNDMEDMRSITLLFLMLLLTIAAPAQTQQVQQGFIRSISRPNRQPKPIMGATVSIGGVTNSVVSNVQGQF